MIQALREEGLVDDAGYARRFAEDRRLLDRWGNERIARDLERRGVERDLVDQALAGHGREDELRVAIELLDRRFPLPFEGDRERDKAWRVLVRRGYEPELAYAAVAEHERGLRDAADTLEAVPSRADGPSRARAGAGVVDAPGARGVRNLGALAPNRSGGVP